MMLLTAWACNKEWFRAHHKRLHERIIREKNNEIRIMIYDELTIRVKITKSLQSYSNIIDNPN
jgi:hypothetical protein